MMPCKVAEAGSPEWYTARNTGIGASEIAAAAGLSPYSTALELYYRKRGELPEIEETDAMRLGRMLEPIVKSEFTRATGSSFIDPSPPMFRHGKHSPILATPDAIISNDVLFEAKTASWRMKGSWGDENSDDVPSHYVCQCQQQMAVMNAAEVRLSVLFDGATLKNYVIERNEELIGHLLDIGLALWDRIQSGVPPEPDWENKSTPNLIRAIHGTINDTRIELSSEIVLIWTQYEELGRMITATQEHRDTLRAQVAHAIGDHYAGLLGDGRMVRRKVIEKNPYTVTPKSYIDVRAVKADDGRIVSINQA